MGEQYTLTVVKHTKESTLGKKPLFKVQLKTSVKDEDPQLTVNITSDASDAIFRMFPKGSDVILATKKSPQKQLDEKQLAKEAKDAQNAEECAEESTGKS